MYCWTSTSYKFADAHSASQFSQQNRRVRLKYQFSPSSIAVRRRACSGKRVLSAAAAVTRKVPSSKCSDLGPDGAVQCQPELTLQRQSKARNSTAAVSLFDVPLLDNNDVTPINVSWQLIIAWFSPSWNVNCVMIMQVLRQGLTSQRATCIMADRTHILHRQVQVNHSNRLTVDYISELLTWTERVVKIDLV